MNIDGLYEQVLGLCCALCRGEEGSSRVYRCVKDEGQFFVLPDVLTWNDVD